MPRKLRKLSPNTAIFRRRAAGETLRELAADYGVSHTSLSRFFKRPEAVRELKRFEQLLRLEQRAEEARFRAELRARAARQRDELRIGEDRWRAKEKAGREVRRRAKDEQAAAKRTADSRAAAAPPSKPSSASERIGSGGAAVSKRERSSDPYHVWLDTPKNLSGRALAEANGRVRLANPEGTFAGWVDSDEAPGLLELGWTRA